MEDLHEEAVALLRDFEARVVEVDVRGAPVADLPELVEGAAEEFIRVLLVDGAAAVVQRQRGRRPLRFLLRPELQLVVVHDQVDLGTAEARRPHLAAEGRISETALHVFEGGEARAPQVALQRRVRVVFFSPRRLIRRLFFLAAQRLSLIHI